MLQVISVASDQMARLPWGLPFSFLSENIASISECGSYRLWTFPIYCLFHMLDNIFYESTLRDNLISSLILAPKI